MNEENLVTYYNKFNEDKRLTHRHGIVEFTTTMKYIKKYITKGMKVLDVGAGSGRYSLELTKLGCEVTAVELVKHNAKMIEAKSKDIKVINANATNLNMLKDASYDVILLFGPMYHLILKEEKIKALNEAQRLIKDVGIIMIQYCMNDYAIIRHGFMDHTIIDEKNNNKVNDNFKVTPDSKDLYSYISLDDINVLNKELNLTRIDIFSPEGPSDYIRSYINKMAEDEFNLYLDYIYQISNKKEMLGAASHLVDIIKK